MIPLILVSNNEENSEKFITDLGLEKSFSPSFTTKIYPLKKELTIDQIRSLKQDLKLSTSQKRLIIFYCFDNATLEAQNALLKTLEEKNEDNQFLFLVRNSEHVIPTIRSRAQILSLDTFDGTSYLIRSTTEDLMNFLRSSNSYEFLSNQSILNIGREEAELLFEELLVYFKRIGDVENKVEILKKILQILSLLQNNNLNPQLAVDNVLIFIKKSYTLKR